MNLHPIELALCIFIGSQVTSALVWRASSLPDNATLSACQGQNVTLHWQYDRDNDEHLKVEEWHFLQDGGNSDKMLAARLHGQFVPEADSTVQLEYLANAGIRLLNVSLQNSGSYYVKVMFNVHGSVATYRRNVHVHVTANGDVVKNGHLSATVQPGATYDNQTKGYHVVLACSTINAAWRNSTQILWTTPDHKVLQTSWWHSGVAYLSVPNPVSTGDYTCKLNQSSLALQCSTTQSPSVSEASVHLDGVEARLSLLEGELQGMRNRENALQGKVDSLQAENQVLKQQLELANRPISFSVSLLNSSHYSSQPVVFTHIISNQGGAFNTTSGQFIVPIAGLYVFHLTVTTTNPVPDSSVDSVYFMIDQHPWRVAESGRPSGYYDTGSMSMVKRVAKGQQVWVNNQASGWHSLPFSIYFSGFLLRAGS